LKNYSLPELIEKLRKFSFERMLWIFWGTRLGEVEDKRFQLFEPEGRVLETPETSLSPGQKIH
jgi:hypothetical protein